jgi:hypothetical protein
VDDTKWLNIKAASNIVSWESVVANKYHIIHILFYLQWALATFVDMPFRLFDWALYRV